MPAVLQNRRLSTQLLVLPTTWASPAHIAALVRAPLRFAKGAYAHHPSCCEFLWRVASTSKFPPSRSVRGARGDARGVSQAASVDSHASPTDYLGIPRSHRYARSRPLTLKRRGHAILFV